MKLNDGNKTLHADCNRVIDVNNRVWNEPNHDFLFEYLKINMNSNLTLQRLLTAVRHINKLLCNEVKIIRSIHDSWRYIITQNWFASVMFHCTSSSINFFEAIIIRNTASILYIIQKKLCHFSQWISSN